MLQDLLHLVTGIIRLGGEGTLRHVNAYDVCHHVGPEPAHQRCAARGVMGLTVIEKETIHLEYNKGGGERDKFDKTVKWPLMTVSLGDK